MNSRIPSPLPQLHASAPLAQPHEPNRGRTPAMRDAALKRFAALVETAAQFIDEAASFLETGGIACECCNLTTRHSKPEYDASRDLSVMSNKLRGLPGKIRARGV